MAKIKLKKSYEATINFVEKEIGPKTYYLHNRCGGSGWEVYRDRTRACIAIISDDRLASWLLLKDTNDFVR